MNSSIQGEDFEFVNKDEVDTAPSPNVISDEDSQGSQDDDVLSDENGDMGEQAETSDGWIDVLGSGQLRKKIVKPGSGDKPQFGQLVTIKYKATYSGNVFEEKEEFSFILGDGETVQAFDLCVGMMEVGEVCMLESNARFAYGDAGYPGKVPPNSIVEFELELLQVSERPNPDEMSVQDKISSANKKRELGNSCFERKDFESAISCYKKATKYLNAPEDATVEEIAQLNDMKVKCLNNQAASYMKIDRNDDALKLCDEVLQLDQSNTKALFRKGQIYSNLNEFDESIACLKQAIKLEPNNNSMREELKKTIEKKEGYKKNEKKVYSRMLRGASTEDTTNPNTSEPSTPDTPLPSSVTPSSSSSSTSTSTSTSSSSSSSTPKEIRKVSKSDDDNKKPDGSSWWARLRSLNTTVVAFSAFVALIAAIFYYRK